MNVGILIDVKYTQTRLDFQENERNKELVKANR